MNLGWPALRLTGTIVLFQGCSLPSYQEWAKRQSRGILKNQNSLAGNERRNYGASIGESIPCDKNLKGGIPFTRMNGVRTG